MYNKHKRLYNKFSTNDTSTVSTHIGKVNRLNREWSHTSLTGRVRPIIGYTDITDTDTDNRQGCTKSGILVTGLPAKHRFGSQYMAGQRANQPNQTISQSAIQRTAKQPNSSRHQQCCQNKQPFRQKTTASQPNSSYRKQLSQPANS